MSNLFDPIIKQKIKILGKDYLKEMLELIDIDQIPQKYGGTGTEDIRLYELPDYMLNTSKINKKTNIHKAQDEQKDNEL